MLWSWDSCVKFNLIKDTGSPTKTQTEIWSLWFQFKLWEYPGLWAACVLWRHKTQEARFIVNNIFGTSRVEFLPLINKQKRLGGEKKLTDHCHCDVFQNHVYILVHNNIVIVYTKYKYKWWLIQIKIVLNNKLRRFMWKQSTPK